MLVSTHVHVTTATTIISYANDVAGVWDRVDQHYPELS